MMGIFSDSANIEENQTSRISRLIFVIDSIVCEYAWPWTMINHFLSGLIMTYNPGVDNAVHFPSTYYPDMSTHGRGL